MLAYFVPFFIGLIVSYALTPAVKKLAVRVGAVDRPEARKVHTHIIPRLGGLAIFIGFMAAVLFSMPVYKEFLGFLLGATAIVCLGIWDDIKNIPAKVKLTGQIIAAAIPVAFGVQIEWVTNPFGTILIIPEWLAVPVTIFWIVGFTNTVNLIDGLDGLAAGVSVIASISMFFMAVSMNQYLPAMILVAMSGAALGFLQYNFKMSGVPIFQPDKGHLHHRLLALGMTQKQAVLSMYMVSAVLGFVAIFVANVSYKTGIVTVIAVLAIIIYSARRIGVLRRSDNTNGMKK